MAENAGMTKQEFVAALVGNKEFLTGDEFKMIFDAEPVSGEEFSRLPEEVQECIGSACSILVALADFPMKGNIEDAIKAKILKKSKVNLPEFAEDMQTMLVDMGWTLIRDWLKKCGKLHDGDCGDDCDNDHGDE